MTETILLHRAKISRESSGGISVFDIDGDDSLTLTPLMKASINGHIEVRKHSDESNLIDRKTALKVWSKPQEEEQARRELSGISMHAGECKHLRKTALCKR